MHGNSIESFPSTWVFSDEVISTILHSRKPSIKSLYNAQWLRFSNWCSKRGVNPLLASIQLICQFVQHLFDTSFQYSTIVGYVFAISIGHKHFTSTSFGSCVAIKQFLKDVFRLLPSVKPLFPDGIFMLFGGIVTLSI